MSTDFGHSSRMYVGRLQQQKIIIYEDDEGFLIIVKRIDGQSSCNYPCNPCSHLPTCHFCSPSLHAAHISANTPSSSSRARQRHAPSSPMQHNPCHGCLTKRLATLAKGGVFFLGEKKRKIETGKREKRELSREGEGRKKKGIRLGWCFFLA